MSGWTSYHVATFKLRVQSTASDQLQRSGPYSYMQTAVTPTTADLQLNNERASRTNLSVTVVHRLPVPKSAMFYWMVLKEMGVTWVKPMAAGGTQDSGNWGASLQPATAANFLG